MQKPVTLCALSPIGMGALTILLLLLTCPVHGVFGQSGTEEAVYMRPELMPLAPEAAAIARYGNIPVGLYTGVPDITVPVYELSIDGLTVPIELKYHSSGVRVDELASNEGLGWSLHAGGFINVMVNGNYDLTEYIGWCYQTGPLRFSELYPFRLDWSNYNPSEPWAYAADPVYARYRDLITTGLVDTEPDVFSYSFPGNSGRFFLDQDKNIHLMPYKNLKARVVNRWTFEFIDEQGNIFLFSTQEQSERITLQDCSGGDNPRGSISNNFSYSFYLTSIRTPKGGLVEFTYETLLPYEYKNQVSATRYALTGSYTEGCSTELAPPCPLANICYVETKSKVNGVRLTGVTSSDGHQVSFTYRSADRLDLPGTNALERIDVSFPNGQMRRCELFHDYFHSLGTSPEDYRLKLDSVHITGEGTYRFSYNSMPLPSRLSFAQDIWGFHNGRGNTTLFTVDEAHGFPIGADRTPSLLYAQTGILDRIRYPTGGFSDFEYELNTAHVDEWANEVQKHSAGLGASFNNATETKSFVLPNGAYNIRGSWQAADGDTPDENGNVTHVKLLGGPNAVNHAFTHTGYMVSLSHFNLLPGTYVIEVTTYGGTEASGGLTIFWDIDTLVHRVDNEPVGGLRIRQVTSSPGAGDAPITRRYAYHLPESPEISSGRELYRFSNVYRHQDTNPNGLTLEHNLGVNGFRACIYNAQTSGSLASVTTLNGGNSVYSHVIEYISDGTDGGYTVHEFQNQGGAPAIISYPFAPTLLYDWLNGLPIKESQYAVSNTDGSATKVREVTRRYKTNVGMGPNESTVRGGKLAVLQPEISLSMAFCPPIPALFATEYYDLVSSWSYLESETETLYTADGPVVKSSDYYYDNHLHAKPTRIETRESHGTDRTVFTSYPHDYGSGTAFLDSMRASHLTGFAIEQVVYGGSEQSVEILSGTLTTYRANGKGEVDEVHQLVHPGPVAQNFFKFSNRIQGELPSVGAAGSFLPDSRYVRRLKYDAYDTQGNPVQVTADDGPGTCFVWGYGGKYPVAEVRNADHATVMSVLGGAGSVSMFGEIPDPTDAQVNGFLAPLRTAPLLDHALVATATYDGLIGVTSRTDASGRTTYYEYDAFQRLSAIRDMEGNLLETYCYNYAGEQVNSDPIVNEYVITLSIEKQGAQHMIKVNSARSYPSDLVITGAVDLYGGGEGYGGNFTVTLQAGQQQAQQNIHLEVFSGAEFEFRNLQCTPSSIDGGTVQLVGEIYDPN